MNMHGMREILKDKRVIDEIHKHLWIESQKTGHSIGLERATEEWLTHYALGWMKYNDPQKYEKLMGRKKK